MEIMLKWLFNFQPLALHGKLYFLINHVSCDSWLTSPESENSMLHALGFTLYFPVPLLTLKS